MEKGGKLGGVCARGRGCRDGRGHSGIGSIGRIDEREQEGVEKKLPERMETETERESITLPLSSEVAGAMYGRCLSRSLGNTRASHQVEERKLATGRRAYMSRGVGRQQNE